MVHCENAELLACRFCLCIYCVPVQPGEGRDWPVYCECGHPAMRLEPAGMGVADCVRVLRVGLRTPGPKVDGSERTWSVIPPEEGIRASS